MRIVHFISFHTIFKFVTTTAVLTMMLGMETAKSQETLVHRPEHVVDRASFEASISGGVGVVADSFQSLDFDSVTFRGAIMAGSASLMPADAPGDRIDPNVPASPFAGVGSLEIVHDTLGTFICSGTVITPNHILTSGHCFDLDVVDDGMLDPDIDLAASKFILNANGNMSSTHTLASVTMHPDFGGFFTLGPYDDLAIVELATPVPMSTPKYAIRNTSMTSGEVLEMVGYGQSGYGDGLNAPLPPPAPAYSVDPTFVDKRSGKNAADLFLVDDEGGGLNEVFLFDFDAPVGYPITDPLDPLFAPNLLGGGPSLGNDIETTVGGGDSGGPAFVQIGGQRVIAGVNTFEQSIDNITPPAGYFGTAGGGIDIAPYVNWVVQVAPDVMVVPEPTAAALLLPALLALGCRRRGRHGNCVA